MVSEIISTDSYLDYLRKQIEEEKVYKPVDGCANCDAVLYEGEEVIIDNCGTCYCDYNCAYEKLGIVEVSEDEELEKVSCENCCEELHTDYVIYKDFDRDYYCSKNCIDNMYGLERKVLEYKED